jgi:hypothetical protein
MQLVWLKKLATCSIICMYMHMPYIYVYAHILAAGLVEDVGHVLHHTIKSMLYSKDKFVSDPVSSCVCMYIYVCVYVFVHMYVRMYMYMCIFKKHALLQG